MLLQHLYIKNNHFKIKLNINNKYFNQKLRRGKCQPEENEWTKFLFSQTNNSVTPTWKIKKRKQDSNLCKTSHCRCDQARDISNLHDWCWGRGGCSGTGGSSTERLAKRGRQCGKGGMGRGATQVEAETSGSLLPLSSVPQSLFTLPAAISVVHLYKFYLHNSSFSGQDRIPSITKLEYLDKLSKMCTLHNTIIVHNMTKAYNKFI